MGQFNFINHTADIALEIRAETMSDLFSTSLRAYHKAVGNFENMPVEQALKFSISALTYEYLLVEFLSEINYLLTARKKYLPEIQSIEFNEGVNLVTLECALAGRNINSEHDELKVEIKAITYHNLKIESTADGYKVTLVFDI